MDTQEKIIQNTTCTISLGGFTYFGYSYIQLYLYHKAHTVDTWTNAVFATNRLGDRLQGLQTIPASFGVSWAVLNLNDDRNNLNFSSGLF